MRSSKSIVRATCLLTATVLTACGDSSDGERAGTSAAESSRQVGARTYVNVDWDTILSVGGNPGDAFLQNTLLIAASEGNLYAYDYFDHRVKAFGPDGQLEWSFGGEGRGPGEFMNLGGLKADVTGIIWALDTGSGRITALTPDGSVDTSINLSLAVQSIIPLRDRLILLTHSPDDFWHELDREGNALDSTANFPVRDLEDTPPSIRQTSSALAPDGETWAAIFPFGNRFLVFSGTELRCEGRYIEGEPFPELMSDPPIWAAAVAMSDSSVFVLARNDTEDDLRIVDVYSADDCSYRHTLPLPQEMRAMAYDDGIFYFEHEDPAPTLTALQPIVR
ncbi:MAG TPA: hypothetical protein VFI91_08470 [Longimicrobiaceae bacterium]|nr:hypothetical protein [Longimicrobiaceae bacterium]